MKVIRSYIYFNILDLNLIALHNINEIRNLQMKKFERNYKSNECEYLQNITKINLEKEKKAIIARIKSLKGEDINLENKDLNEVIEVEISSHSQIDERAIKSSDFSYNLVHIENFTQAGLVEYKL